MTRTQFERLYVGSVVFRENWAWRVKSIDRESGMVVVGRMPESQEPHSIDEVQYAQPDYCEFQKPPLGQHVWREDGEERLAGAVPGMTVDHPDFTCDSCGKCRCRTGGVYRHRVLCPACYWTVHTKHRKRDWRCSMCDEDEWLLRMGKKIDR